MDTDGIIKMCYDEFVDIYGGFMADNLVDNYAISDFADSNCLWRQNTDLTYSPHGLLDANVRNRVSASKNPHDGKSKIIVDRPYEDSDNWSTDAFSRRVAYRKKSIPNNAKHNSLAENIIGSLAHGHDQWLQGGQGLVDREEFCEMYLSELINYEESWAAVELLIERLEIAETKVSELEVKLDQINDIPLRVRITIKELAELVGLEDIDHIDEAIHANIEAAIADFIYTDGSENFQVTAKQIIEESFADEVWGTHCETCEQRRHLYCNCDEDERNYQDLADTFLGLDDSERGDL